MSVLRIVSVAPSSRWTAKKTRWAGTGRTFVHLLSNTNPETGTVSDLTAVTNTDPRRTRSSITAPTGLRRVTSGQTEARPVSWNRGRAKAEAETVVTDGLRSKTSEAASVSPRDPEATTNDLRLAAKKIGRKIGDIRLEFRVLQIQQLSS